MALKLTETRTDHRGVPLPVGVYALTTEDGTIVSYRARWRDEGEDGVVRNRAKSFSARKLGSLDRALDLATSARVEAIATGGHGESVLRADPAGRMTVDDLFKEWCVKRGPSLSERYAEDAIKLWDRQIASRSIARVRLARLSQDPSLLVRFQDSLEAEGMTVANRAQVLKLLRAVLRWGRRRHPNALALDLSGLFELPPREVRRLAYAADAYGLERVIEAVLNRRARDDLLPIRDAAFFAAMGFTIAARPSEWLYSATWRDVHERTVELQRPSAEGLNASSVGLKTGARVALLLPNARERLLAYHEALEARYGPQPDTAPVFGVLGDGGLSHPSPEGDQAVVPLPRWTLADYKRWTGRVWRPAREVAAMAPGAPRGLASMRFYDCRHTAISMALHSTLVMGSHGMNLHNLAAWAGHDVQTLQRYYAHIIARYQGVEPIDLEDECVQARRRVASEPFKPPGDRPGPQRRAQQRRRARSRGRGAGGQP
jgi:hypothetical protein